MHPSWRPPLPVTARHTPKRDMLTPVQEELGPCVDCTLESEIFRTLGLAYVPFHMRWWYGYE